MRYTRVATQEEVAFYGNTLPIGLLPPIAGAAGPTLDHQLGSAATGTNPTFTLSANTTTADLLIVFSTSLTGTPISDSGSNTYTRINGISPGFLWAAPCVTPLSAGASTMTATVVSSTSIAGVSFTGCAPNAATTAYGGAQAGPISTATPSISTTVAVNAGDLVVATANCNTGNGSGSTTYTMPTSGGVTWTQIGLGLLNQFTPRLAGCCAYLVATATGTITFNPTCSDFVPWTIAIAALPGVSLPPPLTPHPTNWHAVRRAMYR